MSEKPMNPRGHETERDRDTCAVCGNNFRDDAHMRAQQKTTPSTQKARAATPMVSVKEAVFCTMQTFLQFERTPATPS